MKKLILLLFFSIALFSCKKDHSGNPGTTNASLLVGKWIYTQDTIRDYKNGQLNFTSNTGGRSFDGAFLRTI